MASLDVFRDLINYTYWGRDRILRAADSLTPEQRSAAIWLDHGSILSTLVHQLSSEVLIRQRCEGSNPPRPLDETDVPTYDALKQLWLDQEAALRHLVDGLSGEDLERPVVYSNRAGVRHSEPLWQLLFQIVNHSTQHRSEVALALTQAGASPGVLDYLAYLWERDAG